MRLRFLFSFLAALALPASAQVADVVVDGNGTVTAPPNFWPANADAIAGALGNSTLSAPAYLLSGNGSVDTLSANATGLGWLDGYLTLQVGDSISLQLYTAGDPEEQYFYWPGNIICETVSAAAFDGSLSASDLSGGVIAPGIMFSSLADLGTWMVGADKSGQAGMTFVDDGTFITEVAAGEWWPQIFSENVAGDQNPVTARYRTTAQVNASLAPTATASIDWPEIAAGAASVQTITVIGAVAASTHAVSLGWSAELPAGIVCSQAWVSSDNTVSIRLTNISASPVDPAAVTVRAAIILH